MNYQQYDSRQIHDHECSASHNTYVRCTGYSCDTQQVRHDLIPEYAWNTHHINFLGGLTTTID